MEKRKANEEINTDDPKQPKLSSFGIEPVFTVNRDNDFFGKVVHFMIPKNGIYQRTPVSTITLPSISKEGSLKVYAVPKSRYDPNYSDHLTYSS